MPHPESPSASAARKRQLRRQFRERRRSLLPACAGALAEVLAAQVPALLAAAAPRDPTQPAESGWLGLYWPLPGEPDLRPVLQGSAACRGRLALPAIAAGRLHYRPWQPGTELQADACGIPAPPAAAGDLAASDLRLILVPALAVDRRGIRLGYGGGWYDRLRSDPDWRRVEALAVLPQGCVVDRLPQEPWDIPMDGWISEAGLTRLCREP
ncbi:5,10-methenyltetrahydrofolate synthetase [Cyanobium sp. PCC 7001]|uniref:5-formyltetrahydrofolate cyclo-ligase n=1 Tax=Cyanobium sp. PCC 7001 TaxID=180281 RepID=UPI0001805564|nr:5-formyltetrahydrofolate cyclo-ligase [Cyanobium sp. PCC 7001]EDY37749.1 5,10-methenyltetrahydrofolate synthetase [Cyanobium sp. PCC 7001]